MAKIHKVKKIRRRLGVAGLMRAAGTRASRIKRAKIARVHGVMSPKQKFGEPDDDIPEMTEEHFRNAKPVREAMPGLIEAAKRLRGRPRVENKLKQVSIRLDPEVLAAFKGQGEGWQQSIRDVLKEAAREIEDEEPRQRKRG